MTNAKIWTTVTTMGEHVSVNTHTDRGMLADNSLIESAMATMPTETKTQTRLLQYTRSTNADCDLLRSITTTTTSNKTEVSLQIPVLHLQAAIQTRSVSIII